MALNIQLSAAYEDAQKVLPPEFFQLTRNAVADLQTTLQLSPIIKVGDTIPSFLMPDALGNEVSSTDLLAQGPLLITFYRGEWCPYCNLALQALQQHLPAIRTRGVTLVAISPELPTTSLPMVEKHDLGFPVPLDADNTFPEKLGIVFRPPEEMKKFFVTWGIDMKARTGRADLDVPIPATLLVDQKGVVRNAFIEPDFVKRLEPAMALEWIDALQKK